MQSHTFYHQTTGNRFRKLMMRHHNVLVLLETTKNDIAVVSVAVICQLLQKPWSYHGHRRRHHHHRHQPLKSCGVNFKD
jgi:hypothetical protein